MNPSRAFEFSGGRGPIRVWLIGGWFLFEYVNHASRGAGRVGSTAIVKEAVVSTWS